MNTAWFSLKRRLLMLLLGGVAAAWLGTFVFSYFDAHHEVDELFDAQMAQAAQTLLALANHDKVSPIENLGEAAHKYQRRLRCQLWNAEGRLLMRSQSAPETPLTAVDGFSETDDRISLVVNLPAARAEGADLDASLLRVAEVYR